MNTEEFDLIVKVNRKDAEEYDEETVIEQIGEQIKPHDKSYFIKETEYFNIFMVELTRNNLKTAIKLAKKSINNYEMVPIESVVLTRSEKILKQIINMSKNRIKDGETFTIRCNIRGRRYIKNKEEFIDTIYREIGKLNGRPDKTRPNWIIHIEVIGENTGVSVLKRNI